MTARALEVHVGGAAARRIADEGWHPDLFSLLMGASGGPKWFILAQLDRFLFGDFLQRGRQPLATLGSSIGSWRHACFAMPDPVAAIDRLQGAYLHQEYRSNRPSAEEVSEVSRGILDALLGKAGPTALIAHPRLNSHFVTARGRGAAGSRSSALLATGMGAAALGNVASRAFLSHHFQRVVFHSGEQPQPGLALDDFATAYTRLTEDNLRQSLHASGAIPFVLTGERDIVGAPPGQYWDGGIIDYHFDLDQYRGDGLILYPHFHGAVIPGWFDKFLPWRRRVLHEAQSLVLLCPSAEFVAGLPHGKIPDRGDFRRFGPEERVRYWEQCVAAAGALAEEFAALVSGDNPLDGVITHAPGS